MDYQKLDEDHKPVNFPVRAGELRKVLKPQRHVFSNRVYLSHCDERPPCRHFQEHRYGNLPTPENNVEMSKLKIFGDSYTQTSKTILQLAKQQQSRDVSPDSLMQSPRDVEPTECGSPLVNISEDNYSLDGSVEEHTETFDLNNKLSNPDLDNGPDCHCLDSIAEREKCSAFSRKVNILDFTRVSQRVVDNQEIFPNMSLTETFLAKAKHKENESDKRSNFHRQNSPLKHSHREHCKTLKSQSFVESYHPHVVQENPFITRFRLKSVRQKLAENDANPKNYLRKTSVDLHVANGSGEGKSAQTSPERPRREQKSSFMSPTIASEQKNILPEVHHVHGLISPIRRGRSSSPKVTNRVQLFNHDDAKVPYIDQSDASVQDSSESGSSSKTVVNKIIASAKLIPPLANRPIFDEDLLRIDELSLDITSSEGNLTGSVRISKSTSSCSLDNAIANTMAKIRDRDWNVALKGLAEVTELCRLIDTEMLYPHMTIVNQRLIELLRSPRSHVCRTACQAAGHLFESMKDTRRPEFDDIVNLLLFKTADANKFIRQDANLSLDCMVTHINTFHAVRTLCSKGPSHKNHLVRTAAARLLVCAVVIAGPNSILNGNNNNEHTRKRIILHMAKFLEDKNLETRQYGARLYKVLCKEPYFDMYLKKYMDKNEITQMKKALKLCDKKK